MAKPKFFSQQVHENSLEFSPISDGYGFYNFATLRCRGIDHLFDTLRYERAFFVRRRDVDNIVAAVQAGRGTLDQFEVTIAAYSWNRKSHWTYGRLLSDMKLTELTIKEVYDLDCEFTATEVKPKLKLRSDITVTAPFHTITGIMWRNRAMPCGEGDSHRIEAMRYRETDHQETVRLTSFFHAEREWEL